MYAIKYIWKYLINALSVKSSVGIISDGIEGVTFKLGFEGRLCIMLMWSEMHSSLR